MWAKCIVGKKKLEKVRKYTGLFHSLWTILWNHSNSFISWWNYLNFWYVTYLWMLCYNLFQNFDYFWSKKTNLWTHFDIFCRFLRGPNEFGSFCVGFFSGKTSSFKKSQKAKIWGCWKKCFLFCLFCTKKFNNLISFWYYYLEDKGLNYQVTKENKPKLKNLSPKIK